MCVYVCIYFPWDSISARLSSKNKNENFYFNLNVYRVYKGKALNNCVSARAKVADKLPLYIPAEISHWSKKGYFLFVYFVCLSVFLAWQDISDKNIAMSNVQDFAACFLSCFYALSLTFRSFIHFEFIFVCGIRRWSSFIFLHASVQFSQHHLLNKLSLAHFLCLLPLSNINWL